MAVAVEENQWDKPKSYLRQNYMGHYWLKGATINDFAASIGIRHSGKSIKAACYIIPLLSRTHVSLVIMYID
jgi:hypothetical protein